MIGPSHSGEQIVPDRTFYARMSRLSAIVMILPSSMGAGWLLGWAVDRMLGTFPVAAVVLTLFGAGAGFYEIYRILSREQQNPDE